MKKYYFLFLLTCICQIQSASQDTSYPLVDCFDAIESTMQKQYSLDIPKDIVGLLLQFIPSCKYHYGKVYFPSIKKSDISVQKGYIVQSGRYHKPLFYDEILACYYCYTNSADYFFYEAVNDGKGKMGERPVLPLSSWYAEDLRQKINVHDSEIKSRLIIKVSYISIYNDKKQLGFYCTDRMHHEKEYTIRVGPLAYWEHQDDDVINLYLRDRKEAPIKINRVKNEYYGKCPETIYSVWAKNPTAKSGNSMSSTPQSCHSPNIVLDSYEESLHDCLKRRMKEQEALKAMKMEYFIGQIIEKGTSLLAIFLLCLNS